jgi:DNA polymerase III epsilon subunit-like protein
VFKGIKQQNVLVFDSEYNEGDLIQFAGILFLQIEEEIFQISKSINIYVKLENGGSINRFIQDFTGISDSFLCENGLSLADAKIAIDNFLDCKGDLLFVSHGLTNDRTTMENNGIDFYNIKDKIITGYCTYNSAKRILKREKKLTLEDIAAEAGLSLSNKHNAADDAWATVAVFSLLCKLDSEEKNEKVL